MGLGERKAGGSFREKLEGNFSSSVPTFHPLIHVSIRPSDLLHLTHREILRDCLEKAVL